EIISFAINLEHIGDIIDKNLSEVAAKKIKRKLQFSNEGAAELAAFHKRVLDSLKIAFGVFMSGDVSEARKLIAEKAQLRNAELGAAEQHLERLREGRPEYHQRKFFDQGGAVSGLRASLFPKFRRAWSAFSGACARKLGRARARCQAW